jgi:hypothetical protein
MEFYLNQKSLPMIRKCGNCKNYNDRYMSCRLMLITSAYDHQKEIFLETGENLYCESHEFKNEKILKAEANRVELNDVKEAMEIINNSKQVKEKYNNINYNNEAY